MAKAPAFRNRLLSAIPMRLLEGFASKLTHTDLPRRTPLERPNKKIEHIYFIEEGITSIVATSERGAQVEVGIIGYEGMTGLPVIHSNHRGPYSAYMQVGGRAHRADAEDVRELMDQHAQVRTVFLAFAQTFLVQVAETAVGNARATIEERLARWLLMAQDRVRSDEIPLTHEFLSLMMGARRPGVTEAIHELRRKGLVASERGKIIVVDRKGLQKSAGSYYGVPEAELSRLLG